METIIPLFDDVFLKLTPEPSSGKQYPTAGLRKGLLLCKNGDELSEEAVGFGVPVIKRGLETIFAGGVDVAFSPNPARKEIVAVYVMNLVEKIAAPGQHTVRDKKLYAIKNGLEELYRRIPKLRPALTLASTGLRRAFRWTMAYEKSDFCATIPMRYRIRGEDGRIAMEADLSDLARDGVTEVAVMNEQGAHFFNRYRDSDGLDLMGNRIGGWDEVTADQASYLCDEHRLAFILRQAEGARLFRGRELVGSRLAWSGFGYIVSPAAREFNCEVRVEKIP
jgi:hypothetical protein